MKKILTLFIITLTLTANAQPFGSDVAVESIGNRRKMETAVSTNGWIYEASYDRDGSGNFHQLNIRRSINGGVDWTLLTSLETLDIDVIDFDLVVLGTAPADLKITLASANIDLLTGEYYQLITRFDGNTGVVLDYPYLQSTGTAPIRSVSAAADNIIPSTSSPVTSAAVAYAVSEPTADKIYVVQSNNQGATYVALTEAASTTEFIREIDLDYGRGATSTWARFYLVYESLPSVGNPTGNIYYTNQVVGFGGVGWLPAVNLTTDVNIVGLCRNPRIAVQRSTSDNSSSSNTVVVLAEYDPTGTNADSDVIGFVNSDPQTVNTWFRMDPSVSADYNYSADIEYFPALERFVITYFNFTSGSIDVAGFARNIVPFDAWISTASNVNDLGINTVAPQTRVIVVPVSNKIGICWIEESPIGQGEVHYDQQGMPWASVELIEGEDIRFYPNPVHDVLNFQLKEGIDVSSAFISDFNGRCVLALENVSTGLNSWNSESLTPGVYFIQLKTEHGTSNFKFIKD